MINNTKCYNYKVFVNNSDIDIDSSLQLCIIRSARDGFRACLSLGSTKWRDM